MLFISKILLLYVIDAFQAILWSKF